MTDMTREQIEQEFRRQVGLCRGLGRDRMLAIVEEEIARDGLSELQPGFGLSHEKLDAERRERGEQLRAEREQWRQRMRRGRR